MAPARLGHQSSFPGCGQRSPGCCSLRKSGGLSKLISPNKSKDFKKTHQSNRLKMKAPIFHKSPTTTMISSDMKGFSVSSDSSEFSCDKLYKALPLTPYPDRKKRPLAHDKQPIPVVPEPPPAWPHQQAPFPLQFLPGQNRPQPNMINGLFGVEYGWMMLDDECPATKKIA